MRLTPMYSYLNCTKYTSYRFPHVSSRTGIMLNPDFEAERRQPVNTYRHFENIMSETEGGGPSEHYALGIVRITINVYMSITMGYD